MTNHISQPNLTGCLPLSAIAGGERQVPLLDGGLQRYINLDNAASTPALVSVRDGVNRFLEYYSSVHRGAGFKSHISTQAYDDARAVVAAFFGANLRDRTVIFGKNTSEALNKLSYRIDPAPDQVIISSIIEHHSNMLPWRLRHQTVLINSLPDGSLDMDQLRNEIDNYRGHIRLVAITGASNVTGHMPPIHEIARLAHSAGAEFLVDAAQLAPHRKIDMRPLDDPERIDYLSISAHKMYAPFGSGALIGPREQFKKGIAEHVGGGEVEMVMLDEIIWSGPPDRDEAGSPNVVGAVALALALQEMDRVGMDQIAEHEMELTAYALERMAAVPRLHFLGEGNPKNVTRRTGVISFQIEGEPNFKVAAILSAEAGIAVRAGCFCAHPYLLQLLGLSPEEQKRSRDEIKKSNRSNVPGAVRASLGIYSNQADIDALVDALQMISAGRYKGDYILDRRSGGWKPAGFDPDLKSYFSLL